VQTIVKRKERKIKKMQTKKKIAILAVIMILSIALPILLASGAVYYPEGTHFITYAQINVAPNPVGVGQTVTVNLYLAVPLETSEAAGPSHVYITDPDGHKTEYGPYFSDATGGTYMTFIPDKTGEWEVYWEYPGQTLTGRSYPSGWGGMIADPSTSPTIHLTVQQEPISLSAYPITPLPTRWWQTPVTAENSQEWYKICGPWLGYSPNDFASCGGLGLNNGFENNVCNPYTEDVLAGHVIWTLPWGAGGIPGGIFGGTEHSNYWMTRQYSPNFAPIIMNGVMYSQQYTYAKTTGALDGILATDLYTGEELFRIETDTTLVAGHMQYIKNVNEYGVRGPWLWTEGAPEGVELPANTGTTMNMWDAFNGNYIGSIINGTGFGGYRAMRSALDESGGLVGYYVESGPATMTVYPSSGGSMEVENTGDHLVCWNMTTCLMAQRGLPTPSRGFVADFSRGIQYSVDLPTEINGQEIAGLPWGMWSSGASYDDYSYTPLLTAGFVHGNVGSGYEQAGFVSICSMDGVDGHQLMLKNLTYPEEPTLRPWTRIGGNYGGGCVFLFGGVGYENWHGTAYDLRTGQQLWEMQLTPPEGYEVHPYDVFNFKSMYANGIELVFGFGGDIWAVNATTGEQMWVTNTNILIGDPGIETPYGIWPLWIFAAQCQSANVAYFGIGHEYDPPLFHGAQVIALNMTNGDLIWSELGTYTRAHAIAQGVYIAMNEYDNQVFAFAKGPTSLTVDAPNVGVTTETPITISGMITDVSPGTKQSAVALNFPNGLPCVSDESQSHWMEYVYQQQPLPTDATGVPITISVTDSNDNTYEIGTVTSDTSGTFALTWTPIISGDYTVVATFDGSNSYYGACAEAHFYASEAPQATPEPTPQPASVADLYFLPMSIGMIIAIVVVGAVVILLLRKR
jgi:hypothetical protein